MKKSNETVLVIGNGFDLHHGMMTSYANMLQFYINVRDNRDNYSLDEETVNAVSKWVDNSFFDYFVSEYEDRKDFKTWIDLEQGIKQYVKTLKSFFEDLNIRVKTKDKISGVNIIGYYESTQEIGNLLINSHALGKTEKDHIEISKKFITFTGFYDIEAMMGAFAEELTKLEGIVAFYLANIEPIIREQKEKYHHYNQIREIDPSYVISFNYTKTICDLYKKNDSQISFIHGNLANGNIVLGYDDIEQNDEEIVFKKYYRRIIKHTDSLDESKMHNQNGAFIDGRDVFIFGHSLDISDEDVLKPILEKCKTTIFYLDEYDYAQKIKNLILLLDKNKALSKIYSEMIRFERIEQSK